MSNITRIILGTSAIVFGLLMIFANLSVHFDWFSYSTIMKVVGLTISGTALYLAVKYIPQLNKES